MIQLTLQKSRHRRLRSRWRGQPRRRRQARWCERLSILRKEEKRAHRRHLGDRFGARRLLFVEEGEVQAALLRRERVRVHGRLREELRRGPAGSLPLGSLRYGHTLRG